MAQVNLNWLDTIDMMDARSGSISGNADALDLLVELLEADTGFDAEKNNGERAVLFMRERLPMYQSFLRVILRSLRGAAEDMKRDSADINKAYQEYNQTLQACRKLYEKHTAAKKRQS